MAHDGQVARQGCSSIILHDRRTVAFETPRSFTISLLSCFGVSEPIAMVNQPGRESDEASGGG